MATGTGPNFATTPHVAAAIANATLDTSLTAPSNVATLFTAGASGSRVNIVRITQVASTAAGGVLNIFLFDGTTYHLFDVYQFGIVTLSTTSEPQPIDIAYQNLVMQTGWSIRFTVTVAAGQSAFKLTAMGGDF